MATSASKKTAKSASDSNKQGAFNSTASKDIWLAGLGAMAQAQAQAREQGSKAFESLVEKGLAFQRQSQATAQEKINEAAAHFNQLTQGLGAGLVAPVGAKVDRLEHLFEDRVARALKSLGLPTAQEVADLQDRVAALETALHKSAPAKAARKAPLKSKKSAT